MEAAAAAVEAAAATAGAALWPPQTPRRSGASASTVPLTPSTAASNPGRSSRNASNPGSPRKAAAPWNSSHLTRILLTDSPQSVRSRGRQVAAALSAEGTPSAGRGAAFWKGRSGSASPSSYRSSSGEQADEVDTTNPRMNSFEGRRPPQLWRQGQTPRAQGSNPGTADTTRILNGNALNQDSTSLFLPFQPEAPPSPRLRRMRRLAGLGSAQRNIDALAVPPRLWTAFSATPGPRRTRRRRS